VVIAIIAILAAILFPVFAQAKLAAKATASLSNLKQIGLAEQMYAGDYDDVMIRLGNFNSGDSDAMTSFGNWAPWGIAIYPYQKNSDILGSSLDGGMIQGGALTARAQATRFTDYGYNYTYLSPTLLTDSTATMQSMSSTSVSQPSSTIQFTERSGRNSYSSQVFWYGPNTKWVITALADTPFCYNEPNFNCTGGWGSGGFWNNYVTVAQDGQLTGGVAFRAANQGIVAFCDGHAKKLSPGAIAAGTNWNPNIAESNIQLTDPTKYLWSAQR